MLDIGIVMEAMDNVRLPTPPVPPALTHLGFDPAHVGVVVRWCRPFLLAAAPEIVLVLPVRPT